VSGGKCPQEADKCISLVPDTICFLSAGSLFFFVSKGLSRLSLK
jgi:hypothetical protein